MRERALILGGSSRRKATIESFFHNVFLPDELFCRFFRCRFVIIVFVCILIDNIYYMNYSIKKCLGKISRHSRFYCIIARRKRIFYIEMFHRYLQIWRNFGLTNQFLMIILQWNFSKVNNASEKKNYVRDVKLSSWHHIFKSTYQTKCIGWKWVEYTCTMLFEELIYSLWNVVSFVSP